jgi:hypothetical protein
MRRSFYGTDGQDSNICGEWSSIQFPVKRTGAQVQFLDTGHFATETHSVEIAAAIREFLGANGASRTDHGSLR